MFWRTITTTGPTDVHAALSYSPSDVLVEIAKSLDTLSDVLSFSLTSKFVYSSVSSVLYERVTLNNIGQCLHTLSMLQQRPEIARHVRELVVRPHTNRRLRQGIAVSALASAAVRDAAATMRFDALKKFVWDGEERPYHEDMWFALRMGCPQLRYIGTSVGAHLPSQNSHLFDFVDLSGFSLMYRRGFYVMHMDMFLDEDNPTSRQLWEMLIQRCPNLEELAIDGVSPMPTDAHWLVEGRWPKLRNLTLGDVSIDWMHAPVDPTQKRPFIIWLEAHTNLESLNLSRHTIQSTHLSDLDSASFQLSSFSGTMQQLQALPHIHASLKSVTFREPLLTRDISPQAVAGLLQGLTSLTELRISFMLHSMYDSGNLLRSLIASCPHLQLLDLTCGSKPSFQLNVFAKTIRGFTRLHSLRLTIVKYPGDESLSAGAVRIAKNNPRLSQFVLTFISPTYPLPLPFALPFFGLLLPFVSHASGSFKLATDYHGLPLSLAAQEQSRIIWPWGFGSSLRSKKYISDLRPLSSPARQKSGMRGVLSLVCERSSAGEEIRMIIFCALLVSLAVWGFIVNQGMTLPQPPHIDSREAGALGMLTAHVPFRFSRGPTSRIRLPATA